MIYDIKRAPDQRLSCIPPVSEAALTRGGARRHGNGADSFIQSLQMIAISKLNHFLTKSAHYTVHTLTLHKSTNTTD